MMALPPVEHASDKNVTDKADCVTLILIAFSGMKPLKRRPIRPPLMPFRLDVSESSFIREGGVAACALISRPRRFIEGAM